MWIESHQSLRNHPKVIKAARLAGISRVEMIGRLHYFWWWAMDYAPNGDITKYDDDDIESAIDWQGERGVFVKALIDCGNNGRPGLIDVTENNCRYIHDWFTYAGKLIEQREKDAERKRRVRQTSIGLPSDGGKTAVVPTNQPTNLTNQPTNQPNQYQIALARMEQKFSESTGIPLPPRDSEKECKASAASWWNPLGISIYKNLCNENLDIALQVIESTVKKMRSAKPEPLTISSPRSIEKVAAAVYADKFSRNGSNHASNQGHSSQPEYTPEQLANAERINAHRAALKAEGKNLV